MLSIFAVFVLADAFVLKHVSVMNDAGTEYEDTAGSDTGEKVKMEEPYLERPEDYTVSADGYEDSNIKISVSDVFEYNTLVHIADIELSSVEFLRTAFAEGTYGKDIFANTSDIAGEHDAILAINGDSYGSRERGYVIRNGVDYPRTTDIYDVMCIYSDGSMKIYGPEKKGSQELLDEGVWQAFSIGPTLIKDGQISVSPDEVIKRGRMNNSRTAIGIIDNNHFVFVVGDGRTSESEGLTLYNLAELMSKMGVVTAYNLDGGGSSTMVFNGEVINKPTSGGGIEEKAVSDIVYIGY